MTDYKAGHCTHPNHLGTISARCLGSATDTTIKCDVTVPDVSVFLPEVNLVRSGD